MGRVMENLATESNVLDLALSSANAGTFLYQVTRKHLSWDDRSRELFGLEDNTYSGDWSEWAAQFKSCPFSAVKEKIERQLAGDQPIDVSYVVETKRGVKRFVRTMANVIRGADNEVIAVSGIHVDLSEKAKLKSALKAAKNQAQSQPQHSTALDPLTRILSTAVISRDCETIYNIASRYKHNFSVVKIQLDSCDVLSRSADPVAWRSALFQAAQCIHSKIRSVDMVGRIAADQFLLVLPDTHPSDAETVAFSLRAHIKSLSISTSHGQQSVSCSFGIAGIDEQIGTSLEEVLDEADCQLSSVLEKGGDNVSSALYSVAELLRSDPHLTPSTENTPASAELSSDAQAKPAANQDVSQRVFAS